MASVPRFRDMSPALTPPPSDRGDYEDTAMLTSDAYLPEVFYPSPTPSFSHQCRAYTPQSPEMRLSDSIYDTDEDNRRNLFNNSAEPQVFANTNAIEESTLYSTAMSYPPYEQNLWIGYNNYPSAVSMFSYSGQEPSSMYPAYMSQAPSGTLPPVPQGVTSASFNFNEPMSKSQDPTCFTRTYSNISRRQQSPAAPSNASVSGFSSRSCSPNLSIPTRSESHDGGKLSSVPHRSSSSSLNSYGIPIRSPDSTTVQAWRCAHPTCTSRAVFTRGCDLRKHYNRHSKHLFCRVNGCPQSEAACIQLAQQQAIQAGIEASDPSRLAVTGGFSSKKDRARHEAKHNPEICCSVEGCGRVFSRMDNMKDHCRRIHKAMVSNSHKDSPQRQQQASKRRSV